MSCSRPSDGQVTRAAVFISWLNAKIRPCVTLEIWEEYERIIPAQLARKRPGVNPRPTLDWLLTVAHFVNASPLGKQRSRDLKDDPYLAGTLGANAKLLVSNDRDLLDLEKPFGVAIVTPVQLLLKVRDQS